MSEEIKKTESVETMFSQSDLNREIGKRLSEESRKFSNEMDAKITAGVSKWREDNGITDDVIEKLTGVEKIVSEAKKIKTEYAKKDSEYLKTQEKLTRVQSHLFDTLKKDAVFSASLGKCVSPKHLFLDLNPALGVDEETMKVFVKGEDGKRDDSVSLESLVTKTLEANPFLAVPTSTVGTINHGFSRGNGTQPHSTYSERSPGDEKDFFKAKMASLMKS